MNIKHKLKTSKQEASRRMKEEETQKFKRKSHYSKLVILYFAFMNIVLEIQTKSQLSQNSKLRMHLKQELVLTQGVSPCKVETVFTISGPKLPH